jgi:putative tricarboxylic transport membrane protein
MKVSDIVSGAAFLLLALAIGIYAQTFPPIRNQPYGAGAFPTVVAVGLGGFSLLLIWRGIQERRAASGEMLVQFAAWARTPKTALNFALALALVVIYILFADAIGFIPISAAILLILFLRMDVRPLTAVAVAIGITIVIQIAFVDLLRVPLPRGILDRVLW